MRRKGISHDPHALPPPPETVLPDRRRLDVACRDLGVRGGGDLEDVGMSEVKRSVASEEYLTGTLSFSRVHHFSQSELENKIRQYARLVVEEEKQKFVLERLTP